MAPLLNVGISGPKGREGLVINNTKVSAAESWNNAELCNSAMNVATPLTCSKLNNLSEYLFHAIVIQMFWLLALCHYILCYEYNRKNFVDIILSFTLSPILIELNNCTSPKPFLYHQFQIYIYYSFVNVKFAKGGISRYWYIASIDRVIQVVRHFSPWALFILSNHL